MPITRSQIDDSRSPFTSRYAMTTRGTKPVSLMKLDTVCEVGSKLKTTRWVTSGSANTMSSTVTRSMTRATAVTAKPVVTVTAKPVTTVTAKPVVTAPTVDEATEEEEATEESVDEATEDYAEADTSAEATDTTEVDATAEATETTEVDATTESVDSNKGNDTDSPRTKRQRKQNEYKSIVRTRSQKLKEAEEYHENMLMRLQNYWATWGKEPTAAKDAELADYIQSLRSIHAQNLKPEFVARVTETNPWFKWVPETKQRTWCQFAGNVLLFSSVASMIVGASYLQIALQNKEFVEFALAEMRTTFALAKMKTTFALANLQATFA